MNFDAVKESLINEAKKAGLSEYEIFFEESESISTESLKGEISSFSAQTGGGIGFRCIVDGHMGAASTELFTDGEMAQLVLRAVENAKNIESSDKAVIFEGSESYAVPKMPPMPEDSAAVLKKKTLELFEKMEEAVPKESFGDGSQTGAISYSFRTELINSHGLHLSNKCGTHCVYAQPVIQKDGESQYGFEISEEFSGEEYDGVTKKAVAEAFLKLGASEIESGKYDVIMDGKQMRMLLSAFCSVFSGRQANLGLSLLKGKEGQKIAADCVTLVDDPMYEGSRMQTGFDGEGVATYKKNIIENGYLQTLLYDIASADKVGKTSTGNGQRGGYSSPVTIAPYHFYFGGGSQSEEELLQTLSEGIYITELNGLHAGTNSSTGDFSIDSSGFRVRGGKKCEAVKSFTIAGNFFELLKNIEAFSSNVKFGFDSGFTCLGSPDVLLRNMSVAGV